MGQTKDILRLRWGLRRSVRETATSLGISVGVVSKTTSRAETAELDWERVEALGEEDLERRLYGVRAPAGESRPEPDPALMHTELKRPGVTLELLHLEYLKEHPNGLQYTAFCDRYRNWKKRLGLTMRQTHKAGEKAFVDFSGKRPCIVDPANGLIQAVELFVAVLGASSYTYAEATLSQQLPVWIAAHIRAVEFWGGSPEVFVPDQLRSAVAEPDKDEPTIQRIYSDFARHYGAIVIPARPRRPRDKAKAEVGVQVAQRWILARLRNETFFSLEELNARIRELNDELNQRRRRHLGGKSRRELFEEIERATLRLLPAERYEYAEWKTARANTDYHIDVAHHWYSVPFTLAHEQVEVRFTATTVEILFLGNRVASHVRSYVLYQHTTDPSHRPPDHRAWADSDPGGLLAWARDFGRCTEAMMQRILESNPHRDQTWRSGRALRRVGDKYGRKRTEVACERALRFGARSYKPVERMLKLELDQRPLPDDGDADAGAPIEHDQVRGPDYYLH